jgi:phenylalanyl-tRNA synthetase alpha chain
MSAGALPDVEALVAAATAAIAGAATTEEIRAVAAAVTGKRSPLAEASRALGQMAPDERKALGQRLGDARATVEAALEERRTQLRFDELAAEMAASRLDLTEYVPGSVPGPVARGHLSLVTQTRDALEDVFVGMGFEVAEGPEIETDWYNFGALNIPRPTRPGACGTPSTSTSASPSRPCCAPTPPRCRST